MAPADTLARRGFPAYLLHHLKPRATALPTAALARQSQSWFDKLQGRGGPLGEKMTAPDARPSGSYLAAGINAISPWGSRNQTPQTHPAPDAGEPQPPELNLTQQSRGADHTVTHRHRLSLKKYPRDCPPLSVQWFHAVDIPKRKALVFANSASRSDKPPQPKKWNPFSTGDSRALEATFQKICDEAEEAERKKLQNQGGAPAQNEEPEQWQIKERNVRWERSEPNGMLKAKVPVNEDFLFDVDVEERELAPAYWIGAVYDVRRGTWFYQGTVFSEESTV
ncbi:hypothetical protein SLS55_006956 [Diplodia seriata]|uniref:C20G8.02-like WWE domain-containing protein n=1 Tax=Diplodia seriata TaxID=420778 RepID=A0ABR3CAY0_9PEZI